jgi:hypothetical protein
MDIVNQPNEILLHIMTCLDIKSITHLGLCAQKFSVIILDESLWKIKLASDLKMIAFKDMTNRDSYKWRVLINCKIDIIWKYLDRCSYYLNDVKPYVTDVLIKSGPTISIDVVWKELEKAPYVFHEDFKLCIEEAIRHSQDKIPEELLQAEIELKESLELLQAEIELKESLEQLAELQNNISKLSNRVLYLKFLM